MTKVWIVSGIVLVGTGVALAGFGAWLGGNQNCDAGDFGRSCAVASLGVAVIGLALSLGGWMRVRRMADKAGDGEESGSFFERRPGLVVIALAVVGLILLSILLPGPRLPVDVFANGAPPIDQDPGALAFATLGGANITDITVFKGEGNRSLVAEMGLVGGGFVRITRFNALTNWTLPLPPLEETNLSLDANASLAYNESRRVMLENASVGNATLAAHAFVDAQYSHLNPTEGGRQCQPGTARHWFVQEGAGKTTLAWAWATFAVEVTAPTPSARDAAAQTIADGPH